MRGKARTDTIKARDLLGMLDAQQYRCALTGRDLTPETASLDHKQPIARGGEHAIHNLWIVHQHINAAKGTMTVEEFVAMCVDVVAHMERVSAGCSVLQGEKTAEKQPENTVETDEKQPENIAFSG